MMTAQLLPILTVPQAVHNRQRLMMLKHLRLPPLVRNNEGKIVHNNLMDDSILKKRVGEYNIEHYTAMN